MSIKNNFYTRLRTFLASSRFLYIVIAIFVLESAWLAFSFLFPMIYDEGTHMGFIQMYSDKILPYTHETPGNMTTQISLFHYLMSFPYRLLSGWMDFNLIVVLFRLVGIGMVAYGLFVYARVLKYMRIPAYAVNIGLLIFILLPITPFVAATINYDNLLFPLTALFMLFAVKVISTDKFSIKNVSLLFMVGCLASLTKYSFLPIFAAGVIFILVRLLYLYRKKFIITIKKSYVALSKRQKIVYGSCLLVAVIAFTGVYGVNFVKYHDAYPSCFDVQTKQQCMKNGVVKRGVEAKATADQRTALPPTNFLYSVWFNNMLKVTNWSGSRTTSGTTVFGQPLPVMDVLVFMGVIFGIGVLLLMWRTLNVSMGARFGILMMVVLAVSVIAINLKGYYGSHAAYANQPRYLLSLLPVLIAMIVWASSVFVGRYLRIKVGILIFGLLLLTQGGGVITHIVRSDTSWYWQNPQLVSVNKQLKDIVSKLVIESYSH